MPAVEFYKHGRQEDVITVDDPPETEPGVEAKPVAREAPPVLPPLSSASSGSTVGHDTTTDGAARHVAKQRRGCEYDHNKSFASHTRVPHAATSPDYYIGQDGLKRQRTIERQFEGYKPPRPSVAQSSTDLCEELVPRLHHCLKLLPKLIDKIGSLANEQPSVSPCRETHTNAGKLSQPSHGEETDTTPWTTSVRRPARAGGFYDESIQSAFVQLHSAIYSPSRIISQAERQYKLRRILATEDGTLTFDREMSKTEPFGHTIAEIHKILKSRKSSAELGLLTYYGVAMPRSS